MGSLLAAPLTGNPKEFLPNSAQVGFKSRLGRCGSLTEPWAAGLPACSWFLLGRPDLVCRSVYLCALGRRAAEKANRVSPLNLEFPESMWFLSRVTQTLPASRNFSLEVIEEK